MYTLVQTTYCLLFVRPWKTLQCNFSQKQKAPCISVMVEREMGGPSDPPVEAYKATSQIWGQWGSRAVADVGAWCRLGSSLPPVTSRLISRWPLRPHYWPRQRPRCQAASSSAFHPLYPFVVFPLLRQVRWKPFGNRDSWQGENTQFIPNIFLIIIFFVVEVNI